MTAQCVSVAVRDAVRGRSERRRRTRLQDIALELLEGLLLDPARDDAVQA